MLTEFAGPVPRWPYTRFSRDPLLPMLRNGSDVAEEAEEDKLAKSLGLWTHSTTGSYFSSVYRPGLVL